MSLAVAQLIIWAVVGLSLAYAAFLAFGGRALFGTRERPEKILGRRARLFQLESGPEGLDREQPALPVAIVESYSPGRGYRLVFETAFKWLHKTEDHAYVSNRSVGYPVSLAASPWRRGVLVHGSFGSGEAFIGGFRLVRE
jgi:hypothetical protein